MVIIPWIIAGADDPATRRIKFSEYFAANEALRAFVARNPLAEVDADLLIVCAMLARMAKTHAAIFQLCEAGYGIQAAMLNRSLTEDLLSAYWARKHPAEAQQNIFDHQDLQRLHRNKRSKTYGMKPLSLISNWTDDERKEVEHRFNGGMRNFTALSIHGLRDEIRSELTDEDAEDLDRLIDVTHGSHNALLHTTALGLNYAMVPDSEETPAFDATPSDVGVAPSLAIAYWLFSRMLRCAYQGRPEEPELQDLIAEHDPTTKAQRIAI